MMGGAIAIAARRSGAATRIVGVAHNQTTAMNAKQRGVVDDATLDLRAGVHDADLVVLCVPVQTILEAIATIVPVCREGTVITDIGSVKSVIVREAEALIAQSKSKVLFVGSHPVTGSEKKGFDAAEYVKLEGATCVLTPTQRTDNEAYRKVDDFWKALGLKTMRMAPDEHDAVLARSSHLPHLVAAALISLQSDRSMDISGPGLRDTTRLAASNPAMWTDIADQNALEISKALKELGTEVLELAREVEALNMRGTPGAEAARERLFRFLADARQRHEERFSQPKAPTPPEEATDPAVSATGAANPPLPQ
jgi:prephenate dehydrogenase